MVMVPPGGWGKGRLGCGPQEEKLGVCTALAFRVAAGVCSLSFIPLGACEDARFWAFCISTCKLTIAGWKGNNIELRLSVEEQFPGVRVHTHTVLLTQLDMQWDGPHLRVPSAS